MPRKTSFIKVFHSETEYKLILIWIGGLPLGVKKLCPEATYVTHFVPKKLVSDFKSSTMYYILSMFLKLEKKTVEPKKFFATESEA